jgi:phi LC3 family holin
MKINWKVRAKNKVFWVAFVPAMLMLIKSIANVFGFDISLIDVESDLLNVVESAFLVLGLVGVVADPTTAGVGDSEKALTYDKPNK